MPIFILLASALSLGVAASDASGNANPVDGQELECMALTIYWEARGESEAGQRAVAHVVLNRVGHPDFPDSICGVVKQNDAGAPRLCQFSWWCDGRGDRPADRVAWLKARKIAAEAIQHPSDDPSGGALYYHKAGVKPAWRWDFQVVALIGDHIFYAPADARPTTKS